MGSSNNLHAQAVSLAQANQSGLAARQSAISAAHPRLGATQIANRALRQVTRIEAKQLRQGGQSQGVIGQDLSNNLSQSVAPDAATVSNGSAGGGGIVYGGGTGDLTTQSTNTTPLGFWGSMSIAERIGIFAAVVTVGYLVYDHFKG